MSENEIEVQIDAFKYALGLINDGWIFEDFAQSFLAAIFNYEFVPVGGSKDRGIDGIYHLFSRQHYERQIFQLSTEKDAKGKILTTIDVLRKNKVNFTNITFVTNRTVRNKDLLIDQILEERSTNIRIFDLDWFSTNANTNSGTRNAYFTYVRTNLQEFNVPGKSYVVSRIETDSRIFVFLRQQLESKWLEFKIDDLLADSLILFALESTDPDKNIFKSESEVLESMKTYVKFDPKLLDDKIKERLKALSTKPRKIQFNKKGGAYCLPYETRLEIAQRNLADHEFEKVFYEQTTADIEKYLKDSNVVIKDVTTLINSIIHKIFHEQGLEFSNFILHGQSQKSVDKDLQETINNAVDESSTVLKNREAVKTCLQIAIRKLVYAGTVEQRRYLKSLSNTYMMMFLLQWNPQVALYFETMASKLTIFVCTSIIVPALSEYYLDDENKRHWNLLKAAQRLGIRIYVTDAIIDELISHLKMVKAKYDTLFAFNEDVYLMSDMETLYVDEILIRAYFHAKTNKQVNSFSDFINNFCSPTIKDVKEELFDYLRSEFGIVYKGDAALKVSINKEEEETLAQKLIKQGKHHIKAHTDAKIILTIFRLREKNGEVSTGSIFGYTTWWLSKDTSTFKAVQHVFKNRYPVSCYMRADFLYNHIALAPKRIEVDSLYKEIFPSLLGVNLSFHLPKEVTDYVQAMIADHNSKNPARVKAIIRKLSENLKADPSYRNLKTVKLFLDEEIQKITSQGK